MAAGASRKLLVRPWYRSFDGTSATITVSLCQSAPVGDSVGNDDDTAPSHTFPGRSSSASWTTSSTTWGAGAQAELDFAAIDPDDGFGYVVIELSTKAETRGLCMCQAGPYEQ
jgi:hypothetical protein